MSVSVNLYQFKKRRNSTRLPVLSELYKTVTGNFVEDSSMYTPNIIFSRNEILNIAKFNSFSISWPDDVVAYRYYKVTDKVIMSDGRIRVSGTEDCFATFRSNILHSKNYISRASANYNTALVDTQYQMESKVNSSVITRLNSTGNIWSVANGVYVLGIVAEEVSSPSESGSVTFTGAFKRGAVKYYVLNSTDACRIMEKMLTQTGLEADYDFSKFIVSCIYIPVNKSIFGISTGTVSDLYFKLTNDAESDIYISISGVSKFTGNFSNGVLEKTFSDIALSNHPQKDDYGEMMNLSPYTTVDFVDGLLGTVPIDISKLSTSDIDFNLDIDLVTGAAKMKIGGSDYLTSVDNKVGVDIAITSITSNSYFAKERSWLNMSTNIGNASAGLLSNAGSIAQNGQMGMYANKGIAGMSMGGAAAGFVVSTMSAVANHVLTQRENTIPSVSSSGSNGGLIGFNGYSQGPIIVQRFTKIVTENNMLTRFPRLVCDSYVLSEFTNKFVICTNATLDDETTVYTQGMTDEEQAIICNQLNAGMFLE